MPAGTRSRIPTCSRRRRRGGVSDPTPPSSRTTRAAGRARRRLWWLLRWIGHDFVRVLDGGLAAWIAAGGEVEAGPDEPAVPASTPLAARPGSMPTVTAAEILGGEVGLLVDARAGERYHGEVEPVDPVAGHIPGAVNVPAAAHPRARRHVPRPRRATRAVRRRRCRRRRARRRLLRQRGHRRPHPARARGRRLRRVHIPVRARRGRDGWRTPTGPSNVDRIRSVGIEILRGKLSGEVRDDAPGVTTAKGGPWRRPRYRTSTTGGTATTRTAAGVLAPVVRVLLGDPPPVRLELWDGSSLGPPDGGAGTLRVHSPDALRRILWSPNELGLGTRPTSWATSTRTATSSSSSPPSAAGCRRTRASCCGSSRRPCARHGAWVPWAVRCHHRRRRPGCTVAATRCDATRRRSGTTTTSATTSTGSCSGRR